MTFRLHLTFACIFCRVMTRKQQLRHYNVEKAEEVVSAKNSQKEELVKAVKVILNVVRLFCG